VFPFLEATHGQDDLALETWSVIGQRVGWTRDTGKTTDYVLWFWQDTGRFFLASFPALCTVFASHWEQWWTQYRTRQQDSGGWRSECTFVPRDALVDALNMWGAGHVTKKAEV
jgi:hypothetical protein